MASEKQIKANQQNAKKSTGPKSQEGKKIVALNAIKHGIASDKILVSGENREAFENLYLNLMRDFQPQGDFEFTLVERIALYTWRLRRIFQLEAYLLEPGLESSCAFVDGPARFSIEFQHKHMSFSTLSRYEVAIERMLNRAIHELQRVQSIRSGDKDAVPKALDVSFGS